jgi:zinc protease
MKLSAAYLTDPGYRPEAQTQWETVVGLFMKQIAAQPMPLLETRLPHLLTGSDGRFGIPPEDALAARSLNEFKAVYGKVAPTAPIEITIVGDVDEAAAIAAVAQSFGALPPRAVLAAPARGEVAWRSKTDPIFLTHSGPADQTVVGSAWRTDDDADFRTAYGLTMLDNALTLLLTESVRERLGASYGASVSSVSSSSFTDHGYLLANAVVDPGKADSVDAAIAEAAKELRDKPLDKDMLERARNPEVEKARRELRQNDYWLSALNEAQSRPDRLDRPRQRIAFLESITAADLQKLARTYLTPERMVRVRVSSDKAPGAKSPGAGAKGERGW